MLSQDGIVALVLRIVELQATPEILELTLLSLTRERTEAHSVVNPFSQGHGAGSRSVLFGLIIHYMTPALHLFGRHIWLGGYYAKAV